MSIFFIFVKNLLNLYRGTLRGSAYSATPQGKRPRGRQAKSVMAKNSHVGDEGSRL